MSGHKLGVVVPYRDRTEHLRIFRESITEYLDSKGIEFELILVEQQDRKDFNRGKLLNIGFIHADELGCDYVVFHDIDMIPIEVDYSYSETIQHLITKLETPPGISRKLFDDYFGGVTLFPIHLFKQINGYSNKYEGWGFEDDDLLFRCKENFIDLQSKEYLQKGKDSVGIDFDGESSYVAIKNTFRQGKDYTVFGSFEIYGIKPDRYEGTDSFSLFSIPGYDTGLFYNSFRHFYFQGWDSKGKSISITSDQLPEGSYNYCLTITNISKKEVEVKLYLNGDFIGKVTTDKLNYINSPSYYFLGAGNVERENKKHFLWGNIDTFTVFNRSLTENEIQFISNNIHFSFHERFSDSLITYFDGKYILDDSLIDLSGRNTENRCFDVGQVRTYKSDTIERLIPFRREGSFKVLHHVENGYRSGYWKNPNSRKNQLKFYDKLNSEKSGYEQDGLTNCRFKLLDQMSIENYHHLQVRI